MNEPLNKKVTKDVVLYWSLQSAPSRALKSFMLNINKDLLFDEVPLDILRGDHKRSEILAINPKGQVPFLIYKKDLMVESASILRFLA
jgi:glutathione S-transferase